MHGYLSVVLACKSVLVYMCDGVRVWLHSSLLFYQVLNTAGDLKGIPSPALHALHFQLRRTFQQTDVVSRQRSCDGQAETQPDSGSADKTSLCLQPALSKYAPPPITSGPQTSVHRNGHIRAIRRVHRNISVPRVYVLICIFMRVHAYVSCRLCRCVLIFSTTFISI